ncbi:MAG: RIP metalloprotease RseP [Pseudomonadota bacterium]
METPDGLYGFGLPFLIILTALVFVHELGHYLVARWNKVRVEVFSVGFGPELFGWTDKAGTRWKFSLIPLGGYVKMFGDANAASMPDGAPVEMTEEERKIAFHYKRLGQRSWIVAAGPLANFLFSIVLLAGLFAISGQPYTPAVVGDVLPDTAAEEAGFLPGDRILEIDGSSIERFEDLQRIVALAANETLDVVVDRDGQLIDLQATPRLTEREDPLGNTQEVGQLGISRSGAEYVQHGVFTSIWMATKETASLTVGTLDAVWQIISGSRSSDELGGPIRIAQMSGQVAEFGLESVIWFMAVLSVNLGLINLFPIPVLDGGHLLFYAIEAIRGKPLGERAQEYGLRIGLALVLSLILFVTWNDLVHIEVVDFVKGLVS